MLNLLACLLTLSFATEAPFWKSKAKVYQRVQDGEVIVSVNAKDIAPQVPRYELTLVGGGQVAAPCEVTYKIAQNYEKIALLSGYITKAKYSIAKQLMDLTIEAFFYSSEMSLEIKSGSDPQPPHIDFRLTTGPMKGFQWQMTFTDIAPKKCEVAIAGGYKYAEFPIRSFFLEFGMQTVFQSMARRLRGYVEDQYRSGANMSAAYNPMDNRTLKWNNSTALKPVFKEPNCSRFLTREESLFQTPTPWVSSITPTIFATAKKPAWHGCASAI